MWALLVQCFQLAAATFLLLVLVLVMLLPVVPSGMILYHLHVSVVLLFTMGDVQVLIVSHDISYPYWYTLYYLGVETLPWPCYMYHNITIFECVLV